MNEHGLPPYIYTQDYHRAFLTVTCDVRGLWTAGYYQWVDPPQDSQYGFYVGIGPVATECGSIQQAMVLLADARAAIK